MLSMSTYSVIALDATLWVAFIAVGAAVILTKRRGRKFRVSDLLMLMAAIGVSCTALKVAFEFLVQL
jgi:hypothetical protein